jgi:hypothetical protein
MSRDHNPVVIEDFNGWWSRGDAESCPLDHFSQADNIQYFYSGFETRDPLDVYQTAGLTLTNVVRIHPYIMQTQHSLLVLTTTGAIYHVKSPSVTVGPILTIPAMKDFNVASVDGRAYITPFFTDVDGYEKGLMNDFLYVYKGDGTPARPAAGAAPIGTPLLATFGSAGFADLGFHLFAVVYETDTGYLTALGPAVFASATASDTTHGYHISNVTVSPDTFVVKRHIVATKAITNYDGNQDGFIFYFIPNGIINDNVGTTIDVSFFDIDLLEDASHLIDNFAQIPAGVGITTYHGRLILTTTFTDISVAYGSASGEPEAINQVDGLMIVPLDGRPLTNCQEYRDVLYLFKASSTVGYSDNQDDPATWASFKVDEAIGCPVHGIATVLDSGGVNVDYLLIADLSGLMIFNGSYATLPLSYNIENYWFDMPKADFEFIQIVCDSLGKKVWMTLPSPRNHVLLVDYNEGLTKETVKWARWIFDANISSLCLTNINQLVVGALSTAV